MTVRVMETALITALASAMCLVGAVALGWASGLHGLVVAVGVTAAAAVIGGVQHVTGYTTLAPVEPIEEDSP
jgi:fatty acid desaturase